MGSCGKIPSVQDYENSLRLVDKYVVDEERELTSLLIHVLKKISVVHPQLVFTPRSAAVATWTLCEFATSLPDICVYNVEKLKTARTVHAAVACSTSSALAQPVQGLPVECKQEINEAKVLNQAIANMVKLGCDLTANVLTSGR